MPSSGSLTPDISLYWSAFHPDHDLAAYTSVCPTERELLRAGLRASPSRCPGTWHWAGACEFQWGKHEEDRVMESQALTLLFLGPPTLNQICAGGWKWAMPRLLLQQQRFPMLAQCSTDRSMFQIPCLIQGLAPGKMGSSPTKATQPDCCSATPPGVS